MYKTKSGGTEKQFRGPNWIYVSHSLNHELYRETFNGGNSIFWATVYICIVQICPAKAVVKFSEYFIQQSTQSFELFAHLKNEM